VAVVVDTTDEWGRSIVRGIGNYSRACGSWRIWLWPWGRGAPMPLSATWDGHGIIAGLYNHGLARALTAIKKPMVNVSAVRIQNVSRPCLPCRIPGLVNSAELDTHLISLTAFLLGVLMALCFNLQST